MVASAIRNVAAEPAAAVHWGLTMRWPVLPAVIALFAQLASPAEAIEDADAAARRLMDTAVALMERADAEPDRIAALPLYTGAVQHLMAIDTKYPTSAIALSLAPDDPLLQRIEERIAEVHVALETCRASPDRSCVFGFAIGTFFAFSIVPPIEIGDDLLVLGLEVSNMGGELDEDVPIVRAVRDAYYGLALGIVAETQAKSGALEAALNTADGIKNAGRRSLALSLIAGALVDLGQIDTAHEIANGIEDGDKRDLILSDIAKAQTESGQLDAALETTHEITSLDERDPVLSSVATAQIEADRIDEAFGIANTIEDRTERNSVLGHVAIAQAEAGKFDTALETIEGLDETSWLNEVLAATAATQAETGDFESALTTAQGIEDPDWQRRALINIAVAQGEAGEGDAARDTFDAVLATAKESAGSRRYHALSDLANSLADAREFDRALVTASHIQHVGPRDAARANVAVALLKAGNFDAVHAIIIDIHSSEKRALLLSNMAVLQVWEGDQESAKSSFEAALAIADDTEYEDLRDTILYMIAMTQARVGRTDVPLPALDGQAYFQIYVLNDIAKTLAENGYQEAARIKFDAALELARNTEGSGSRIFEIARIASAQADAGVRDGARDTVKLLLTMVFEPEYERERGMILSTVAEVQVKLGDLGAALEHVRVEWNH